MLLYLCPSNDLSDPFVANFGSTCQVLFIGAWSKYLKGGGNGFGGYSERCTFFK